MSLTTRRPPAIADPGGEAAGDVATSTGRATTTTAPRAHSDEALLLDVAAGDQRAFATLYDRVAGPVYTDIRRVLCDADRTDAVVEEAFLGLWRSAPRFDAAQMPAVAWISGLTHRFAEACVDDDGAPRASSTERGAPPRTAAAAAAGAPETDGPVRSAFAGLSEPQQRAIELASVVGATHHHVAAQLGASVATVHLLLRDGLIRLGAARGQRTGSLTSARPSTVAQPGRHGAPGPPAGGGVG